jgi:methylthioribose-1-phosphate isomerase
VDAVVVGADRIAVNGDVVNKVGTYPLAVLARAHGLPFYVAAPASTFDPSTATGAEVAIEERDRAEVVAPLGLAIAPEGTRVVNPAFDVTPATLVSALVTEQGVSRPPFRRSLPRLLHASRSRRLDVGAGA